ncbi:MAG TPA: hypothetical protein VIG80_06505, partial [Bacillaceae bacterium]
EFSLKEDQKKRILASLHPARKNKKKKWVFAPVLSVMALCTIFTVLVLSELDIGNGSFTAKQPQSGQIELDAPEGKEFIIQEPDYKVIGIEGRVGILNTFNHFVAEDTRRGSKIMLYYWGNPEELVGEKYRVEAVSRFNEKIILSEGVLGAPLYGEDAHTLTRFEPFPKEGIWQLSFYVGDSLFEEFTLDVLPPFPKTEHYTLVYSPKELPIGKEAEMFIESTWKDKKKIEVRLLNKWGKTVQKTTFKGEHSGIDAKTMKSLYMFSGKLEFPEKGTWRLEIDGEKTGKFEN